MQTVGAPTKVRRSQNTKPPEVSKKRSLPVVAIDCLVSGALIVAGLELLFTFAGVGQEDFFQIDKRFGFAPMPGKTITFRREGYSRTTFNSFGMRDKELTLAKAPGTVRIALLGDSLTEAVQVDRKETFAYLLEKNLNANSGKSKFEVLNFGVGGYYLPQKYLRLKEMALDFQPDLAVIVMRVGEPLGLLPRPLKDLTTAQPFFLLDGNGKLVEERCFQNQWNQSKEAARVRATAWLTRNSCLWGVIGTCMRRLSQKAGPSQLAADTPGVESYKYVPIDPYLKKLTKALILQSKRECEKKNCRLALVYMTGLSNLIKNPAEEEFLIAASKELGVPMLDMRRPFEQAVDDPRDPIRWGHLAQRGHRLVASELCNFVESNFPQLGEHDATEVTDVKEQKSNAL